jgi:hypothetical protein
MGEGVADRLKGNELFLRQKIIKNNKNFVNM